MQKIKPKNNFTYKKLAVLGAIGISVLIGVVALFNLYYRIVNPETRSWDEKSEIQLSKMEGEGLLRLEVGCEDCNIIDTFNMKKTSSAYIYITKDDFLYAFSIINDNPQPTEYVTERIRYSNDLNSLADDLRGEYSVFYASGIGEAVKNVLLYKEASVYDVENDTYVEKVMFRNEGIVCGPLCGSGTESFEFEDGRTFWVVSGWIS